MRRVLSIVIGTMAVVGSVVAVAPPAQATTITNKTLNITKQWVSFHPANSTCARWTVDTKITYQSVFVPAASYPQSLNSWSVQNAKLFNPVLTVKTYSYEKVAGCTLNLKNVDQLQFGQHWGGHECSFNPSIQLSLPWAIGVSAWPVCGTKYQIRNTDTTAGPRSTFQQNNYNNGNAMATWTGILSWSTSGVPSTPCLSVFVDGKVWKNGVTDSFGTAETSAKSVCLPY